MSNPYMTTKNVGKNPYVFAGGEEVTPTSLQLKEDGGLGNKPSFCMTFKDYNDNLYYGQFSLDTIKDCFKQLGYDLKKNEP
jgi:hypothetical protein